ncbi:hypothetical protein ACIRBX_03890 [Kitasatospora sp. NPDC096147]|uniref:hypothetical protein n=1 Tax=Kitasatospora sp. NPDC096147 TaxID=3364093 RepID=UPI0038001F61
MKPKVNIIVLVDVIGALSDGTLHNGNLSLVDDAELRSTGQGTTELCTVVSPGQVVGWTVLAVDLQTPVEIRSITFLGPDGAELPPGPAEDGPEAGVAGEQLDLDDWTAVVPASITPGVPQHYRLELRMHQGPYSLLHLDSPALLCG